VVVTERYVTAFNFLHYVGDILGKYTFFCTVDGHIGLAPVKPELGDYVAVIPGPLVIRHANDGQAYTLIGPCYVYGLMEVEHPGCNIRLPRNVHIMPLI
jgi:hypothetical protein